MYQDTQGLRRYFAALLLFTYYTNSYSILIIKAIYESLIIPLQLVPADHITTLISHMPTREPLTSQSNHHAIKFVLIGKKPSITLIRKNNGLLKLMNHLLSTRREQPQQLRADLPRAVRGVPGRVGRGPLRLGRRDQRAAALHARRRHAVPLR